MEFVPLAAMGSLVFTLINFFRYITNKDTASAITQIISWGSGVLVVFLVSQTDFASGVIIGDKTLDTIDAMGLLFVGLMASSLFGFAKSALQAFDNSDTARTRSLLPGSSDGNPHDNQVVR